MKTPILGSAYVARSINAANNRMVNLFPEVVPEGGKEAAQRAIDVRVQRRVAGRIKAIECHVCRGARQGRAG